jgi:hypothetical protein
MIEMSTMKGIIKVMPYKPEDCALPFVEASSGEFWVHVLQVLGCLIFCTISLSLSLSLSFPVFHNYELFGLSDLHSFLILQQTQFCQTFVL